MSADNWIQCPRCLRRHAREIERFRVNVDASYGNVPVEEFDQLRAALKTLQERALERTFSEYWEIGILHDGDSDLIIDYRGACNVCGLEHKRKERYVPWSDEELDS